MIPVFRPPVHISREEKISTLPKEKLFSYHEVENILCQAICDLNSTELIKRNNIDIEGTPNLMARGVVVTVRQGNEICKLLLKGGADNEPKRIY